MITLWVWDEKLEKYKSVINETFRIREALRNSIKCEEQTNRRALNDARDRLIGREKRLQSPKKNQYELSYEEAIRRSAKLNDEIRQNKEAIKEFEKRRRSLKRKLIETQKVFDEASLLYACRLDYLHRLNDIKKEEYKLIAEMAGVPEKYLYDVIVYKDDEGFTNIFFGGVGWPLGEWHGHYVMNSANKVTYARPPFKSRGIHNFVIDLRKE